MNQQEFVSLVTEEAAKINPAWLVTPATLSHEQLYAVDVRPFGPDGPTRGIAVERIQVVGETDDRARDQVVATLRRLDEKIRNSSWPLPAIAEAAKTAEESAARAAEATAARIARELPKEDTKA